MTIADVRGIPGGRLRLPGPWAVVVAASTVGWAPAAALAQAAEATPPPPIDPAQLVEIDWFAEMIKGGWTMVALAILSVGLVALLLDRLLALRLRRFAPPGLVAEVLPLFAKGQHAQVLERCQASPSTLSEIVAYFVEHRRADPQVLAAGASDLGQRAIAAQEQRAAPIAAVAALAPLLGLLGTMIGMIEAFSLVAVFGDEGGASMLADSISKALITTAVGLILAIPAIVAHLWAQHRVHTIASQLERDTERLFNAWFVPSASRVPAAPGPRQAPPPPPAPTPARAPRAEPVKAPTPPRVPAAAT